MSLSMYQASAPVFVRQLKALSVILGKGATLAAEKGNERELVEARLAPDMFPLSRQVQIATDAARGATARLAGMDVPSVPDEETSFAELEKRVADTIAFIENVPAEKIDGSEGRAFTIKMRQNDVPFVGQPFLLHFALPNFFFHVLTAYAILRAHGVPVGKIDYLGGL